MLMSTHQLWLVSMLLLGVGGILVVRGWRGRRLDDHPLCSRCRFDLHGLGIDTPDSKCPECGVMLEKCPPRIGNRKRSPARVITGATLLLVMLVFSGIHHATQTGNLRPYQFMPTGMLLSRLDREVRVGGSPGLYWYEIQERRARLSPNSSHEKRYLEIIARGPAVFVDVIRHNQANSPRRYGTGPIDINLIRVAEQASHEFRSGNLAWSDLMGSITTTQDFLVDAPQRIRLDDPISVYASYWYWTPEHLNSPNAWPPYGLPTTCSVEIVEASIGGVRIPKIADAQYEGKESRLFGEGLFQVHFLSRESGLDGYTTNYIPAQAPQITPRMLGLDVGEHEFVLKIRLTPEGGSPLRHLLANTSAQATPDGSIELVHRSTIRVVNNSEQSIDLIPYTPQWTGTSPPNSAKRAQIVIDQRRNQFQLSVSQQLEYTAPHPPPVNVVPMEVILRVNGEEILLNYSRYGFSQPSWGNHLLLLSGESYPLSMLPENLNDPVVIYRTSHAAAAIFGYSKAPSMPDIEIPLEIVDP